MFSFFSCSYFLPSPFCLYNCKYFKKLFTNGTESNTALKNSELVLVTRISGLVHAFLPTTLEILQKWILGLDFTNCFQVSLEQFRALWRKSPVPNGISIVWFFFHCMLKDEFMHYRSITADSNQSFACTGKKKNLLCVIEPSLKDIEMWWTTTIFWLSQVFFSFFNLILKKSYEYCSVILLSMPSKWLSESRLPIC